eukprot:jgi/Botrbrau1/8353/Bobra.0046s0014.2
MLLPLVHQRDEIYLLYLQITAKNQYQALKDIGVKMDDLRTKALVGKNLGFPIEMVPHEMRKEAVIELSTLESFSKTERAITEVLKAVMREIRQYDDLAKPACRVIIEYRQPAKAAWVMGSFDDWTKGRRLYPRRRYRWDLENRMEEDWDGPPLAMVGELVLLPGRYEIKVKAVDFDRTESWHLLEMLEVVEKGNDTLVGGIIQNDILMVEETVNASCTLRYN